MLFFEVVLISLHHLNIAYVLRFSADRFGESVFRESVTSLLESSVCTLRRALFMTDQSQS